MEKWIQGKNCERVIQCHSRNCDSNGNAEFAVIGDDLESYCSNECAIDEQLEKKGE